MEVKKEDLKGSKAKLQVTVPPSELAAYFRTVYERLAPGVKIDGFRAGKAPYKMVLGVLGYNRLLSEGLDEALNQSYGKALAEAKVYPVGQPKVDIKKSPQFSLDETEIMDDLLFEIEVDQMPEVRLRDYSKASVKPPKKQEANEDEVEKIIDQLRKQKATFKERVDGAQRGDRVEISFSGSLKGVKLDKMSSKNHPLILGEGNLIPGFEDNIRGMKKGEEKEFKIRFPKDYHDKEVADKEASFSVTLHDVKEVVLPELNGDFAKGFGHPDVKKLKSEIKKSLEVEIEKEHREKLENAVIDKMAGYVVAEIPHSLIDQEVERIIHGYKKQIEGYGVKFDKYLESMKKSEEDLRHDIHPQAEKNVKVGLMLGKIIEEQKIDHHDKEAGRQALDYLIGKLVKDRNKES